MKYKHPNKYKDWNNQDRARLMVEENCLKCSEFMGQCHDFSECDLTGKRCPQPFQHPSVFCSKDMVKLEIEADKECPIMMTDREKHIKNLSYIYENRLKADMVAMLTDIQLEIEEMTPTYANPDWSLTDLVSIGKVNEVIQQKIDKLKE